MPARTRSERAGRLTVSPVLRGQCLMTAALPSDGVAGGTASSAFSFSSGSGTGWDSSACSNTCSIQRTGWMSRRFLISSGISTRSFTFSSGISTVLMPPRPAASNFSFSPPIGSTSPRNVISPVIATSQRTGMPVMIETIAVHTAAPAEGPSFGVAPSGKWICRSVFV